MAITKTQASGTGLTLLSTLAPTLGFEIPYFVRVIGVVAGAFMLLWPVLVWAFNHLKQRSRKTLVFTAVGILLLCASLAVFLLAPKRGGVKPSTFPDIAREFERARIPQLGQPVHSIEETTAVYQAAHEHAMVVSLLPTLDVFVFPYDRTQKAVRQHTATFLDAREWFNDAFLRGLFKPPKDKNPPESRVAELWSQNPNAWKWIGWRAWSCPFVSEKFYYQKFENGIIFGILPTSETGGVSQIFAFANSGEWNSTTTEAAQAPACNENTAKVNGIPIHGRFVR
jgi:hypothetical protein